MNRLIAHFMLVLIVSVCSGNGLVSRTGPSSGSLDTKATTATRVLPEVIFRPTGSHYDYGRNDGSRPVNYDPTNGVTTADVKPPPFGRVLNLLRDENSTLPVRIIFDAREAPESVTTGSKAREWRHVITDAGEIQSLMNALASVRLLPNAEWWWVPPGKHAYVYRLTLDFGEGDGSSRYVVESITLNISDMIANGFDFSRLEQALSKYPPGFKAQRHAMLE